MRPSTVTCAMLCGLKIADGPQRAVLYLRQDQRQGRRHAGQFDTGYGDAYMSGFHKLWRLQ